MASLSSLCCVKSANLETGGLSGSNLNVYNSTSQEVLFPQSGPQWNADKQALEHFTHSPRLTRATVNTENKKETGAKITNQISPKKDVSNKKSVTYNGICNPYFVPCSGEQHPCSKQQQAAVVNDRMSDGYDVPCNIVFSDFRPDNCGPFVLAIQSTFSPQLSHNPKSKHSSSNMTRLERMEKGLSSLC